jgi:acid stress-induced BolA-like protein IbaG/YrbA
MMTTPEDIKIWIEENLAESQASVEGDGQHFEATVICPAFVGKNMLQRHRMVYEALGDRMKSQIHALSLKALAPNEIG